MNPSTEPEIFIEKYIFPIFLVQTKEDLIYRMTCGTIIYGILMLLNPSHAPYGRFTPQSVKMKVPAKIGWFVQESPSFFISLILAIYGSRNEIFKSVSNQLCLGMFTLHYFQRSFIFAALMKSSQGLPVRTLIFAFITTTYNGILHGLYFVSYQSYRDSEWLTKPYFWIGFLLFIYGMSINIGSDSILRNLRKGDDKEYKIPKGGMFKYVSCANYYGEIVQMWGYALASCSPPACAFAFFTTSYLAKRALQHHQWYLKKFDDYPKERKAVFPFIL